MLFFPAPPTTSGVIQSVAGSPIPWWLTASWAAGGERRLAGCFPVQLATGRILGGDTPTNWYWSHVFVFNSKIKTTCKIIGCYLAMTSSHHYRTFILCALCFTSIKSIICNRKSWDFQYNVSIVPLRSGATLSQWWGTKAPTTVCTTWSNVIRRRRWQRYRACIICIVR